MKYNYITLKLCFLLFTNISLFAQNDYNVLPIPHQAYVFDALPLTTNDDEYSGVINIGFSFDFFGNNYDQLVVSTNGFIDFQLNNANMHSQWTFNQSIPNTSFPVKNSILGCYHDLDNRNQIGSITYASIGIAPFRKFVVDFSNQPHFQCAAVRSSFQMIIYETFNYIDIQLVDKGLCATWNQGNAVTGIINLEGNIAFTPPGRNTGAWAASQEGWRFARPFVNTNYNYTICDDTNLDGFGSFNLNLIKEAINEETPENVTIHETLSDAELGGNSIPGSNYTNINPNYQNLYANFDGVITTIVLSVIDCSIDYDNDTVNTELEDVNGDGNLANDDTDGDGIPDYLDNDDDGDLVLTEYEYVFPAGRNSDESSPLDTDLDGIPDYLDNDDDGDGVLTIDEDYNGNNNPMDDDINSNGIPDYLDNQVALGLTENQLSNLIKIYPNPAENFISIANQSEWSIDKVSIYSINGSKVIELNSVNENQKIDVSNLQSGLYLINIQTNNKNLSYKFIRK